MRQLSFEVNWESVSEVVRSRLLVFEKNVGLGSGEKKCGQRY